MIYDFVTEFKSTHSISVENVDYVYFYIIWYLLVENHLSTHTNIHLLFAANIRTRTHAQVHVRERCVICCRLSRTRSRLHTD